MLIKIKDFWSKTARHQKIALLSLASFLILGPVAVLLTPAPVSIYEMGLPVTPPVTPPDYLHPVSWQTPYVSLKADDFYIIADGRKFLANASGVRIHSDPGNNVYTTLEAIWQENGVEMRLFIYFYAEDIGSYKQWGVSEIRTYNGQTSGDWIYYRYKTPLAVIGNTYFTDQLNLNSSPGNKFSGEVHFKNLYLKAFDGITSTPGPSPFPPPSSKPSPSPWVSPPPRPTSSPLVSPGFSPGPSPRPVSFSPVIMTDKLPVGYNFRPYSAAIVGYDADRQDKLSMSVRGLPPGLNVSRCLDSYKYSGRQIHCLIKGWPIFFGRARERSYNVRVTLRDNHGNVVTKTLVLKIQLKPFKIFK